MTAFSCWTNMFNLAFFGGASKEKPEVSTTKFTFPQTYFNILSNTIQCALQSLHEGAFNNPLPFQAFIPGFRSLPFCCGAADILIGAAHFVRSPCSGISPPLPFHPPPPSLPKTTVCNLMVFIKFEQGFRVRWGEVQLGWQPHSWAALE